MAKKKKCPECPAGEKWAVPYADFLSLLLALFIALYAISAVNISKVEALKTEFIKIFEFPDTKSLKESSKTSNSSKEFDNPAAMAAGIAGAFTATVTGIMGAYAFFGPWGMKIIGNAKDIVKEKVMILEALVGIAEGANPRSLEAKLFNFLDKNEPRISQFN